MAVTVLRLGHRPFRDKRISTHCGLVARAFGASELLYSGEKDSSLEDSINSVSREWGGSFHVRYVRKWKDIIKEFPGKSVHLTMYGLPLQTRIREIRKHQDILVIIGGEKVPSEVYSLSDYNIAVTNQPHSEVAALAVFLHEYFESRELSFDFPEAKKRVIPRERGKLLEEDAEHSP